MKSGERVMKGGEEVRDEKESRFDCKKAIRGCGVKGQGRVGELKGRR